MDAKSSLLIIVQIILISLNSYSLGLKTYYKNSSSSWFNYIVIILLYASIFARLLWKAQ